MEFLVRIIHEQSTTSVELALAELVIWCWSKAIDGQIGTEIRQEKSVPGWYRKEQTYEPK